MKTKTIVISSIIVVFLLGILLIGGLAIAYFNISNEEISLRNQAKAQEKANEVIFDKTWKTIQQIANVSDQYKNSFKEIYSQIMNERYKNDDGMLMKWIQESTPTFSTDLYKQLNDAISANRAEFAEVQKRLIDIKRVHDDLRLKFPSSIVLSGRPEIEIKIVTSSKTEKAFSTGKDDDINLFENKK